MVVYKLAAEEGLPLKADLRRQIRPFAEAGLRSLEIDVRLAPSTDGEALSGILKAATEEVAVSRLHCTPSQWNGVLRNERETLIDVHLRSRALAVWQDSVAGAASACGLTVELEPRHTPPPLRIVPAALRVGFVAPWECDAAWADYAPAARVAVSWISSLAAAEVPVSIAGALPFCIFADAEQGLLARECLAADDYRRPAVTLALSPNDTVTPWYGPLCNLVRVVNGTSVRALQNFYKARERMLAGGIEECRACALRDRECSAWHFHSRPDPAVRAQGVLPLPDLVHAVATVRLTPHPCARVRRHGDGAELFVDGDRTLAAVRLNDVALSMWNCITAHERLDEFLRQVCATHGDRMALPSLQILTALQESGFVACRTGIEEET